MRPIEPHAYIGYRGSRCQVCGETPGNPVHSGIFQGMETAVAEQEHAAALQQAEDLAETFKQPLGDINRKAGNMEENSPLFFGKVNPTLF